MAVLRAALISQPLLAHVPLWLNTPSLAGHGHRTTLLGSAGRRRKRSALGKDPEDPGITGLK